MGDRWRAGGESALVVDGREKAGLVACGTASRRGEGDGVGVRVRGKGDRQREIILDVSKK